MWALASLARLKHPGLFSSTIRNNGARLRRCALFALSSINDGDDDHFYNYNDDDNNYDGDDGHYFNDDDDNNNYDGNDFSKVWKAVLKLDPDHSDARVGLRKGKRFDGGDSTMIMVMT